MLGMSLLVDCAENEASILATPTSLPEQREVESKDSAKILTNYQIKTERYRSLAK
jgi:hypothetical protein